MKLLDLVPQPIKYFAMSVELYVILIISRWLDFEELYSYTIPIMIIVIVGNLFANLLEAKEKCEDHYNNVLSFCGCIFHIFLNIFASALLFALLYYMLYESNNSHFPQFASNNIFNDIIEITFYSIDNIFSCNLSNVGTPSILIRSITFCENILGLIFMSVIISDIIKIGQLSSLRINSTDLNKNKF